jgi:hypothetical protein
MKTLRFLLVMGTLAMVIYFLFWRLWVRPSQLRLRADGVHFPVVSGANLDRQEKVFPRDFEGELNLLFIPFLQEQQTVVNTWLPFAEKLESSTPGLVYYELPTIRSMPMVSRTFINEGMRAGIPDPKARQRTITLYIDLDEFMAATEIDGRNDVHTLLVNRNGDILWRTTGVYDEVKGEALRRAVETSRS